MTKTEEIYATWLNTLGSDPVPPGPVEGELRVMRVLATSDGDSQRLSSAYLDVLLTLAEAVGQERAKELTDTLLSSALAHRVQYIPGMPLMIDGVDCSPENVRHLEFLRDEYRALYLGQGVEL